MLFVNPTLVVKDVLSIKRMWKYMELTANSGVSTLSFGTILKSKMYYDCYCKHI
jgi:hypothetical protein